MRGWNRRPLVCRLHTVLTESRQEVSGRSTLLIGGRIIYDASYGMCMAAQFHCYALIRGDGAYMPLMAWHYYASQSYSALKAIHTQKFTVPYAG
jgi:hypothetical protein